MQSIISSIKIIHFVNIFLHYYYVMAHKKAAWSAKNLRDSNPKYRWLKLSGWQAARAWNIIIRQKGDTYKPWRGVYKWKDFTIHAQRDGIVTFRKKKYTRFDWRKYERTVVEVVSPDEYVVSQSQSSTKTSSSSKKPGSSSGTTSSTSLDDLTKIHGIDQTIQTILHQWWISTYADLSWIKIADLRALLAKNDIDTEPKHWKKQATLAKNWKRDELATLQHELSA